MVQAEISEKDAQAHERVREDLLSGRYFTLHEASARSRYGYEPPVNRDAWSRSMKALAEMARESDAQAQIASAVMGRVNLYGTNSQAQAAIWQYAAEAVRKGYDDVIGRSGPEGGRYKVRPFAIEQLIVAAGHLAVAAQPFAATASGHGWVLVALARQYNVRLASFEARR